MYLPPHFEETNPAAIAGLIAAHPLATLVSVGEDGINADHIPLLFDPDAGEKGRLIGHVARSNQLWRNSAGSPEVLAIFEGPSAYISPNWYLTKQATHQVVPTYNYAVAHLYGPLIVHEDEKWLRGVVGRLTKAMERTQETPWKMADAPADYLVTMLGNIVGIEIPVTRVIGKWKVSQNRVVEDRVGAAEGLRAIGDDERTEMAELILSRLPT
jgi:transcriptional regulator